MGFTSCDDGDIVEVNLEFDRELELCGDDESDDYLLYDIKTNPNESLSLLFPVNGDTRQIFRPESNGLITTLNIDASSTRFNYRVYDGDPEALICKIIPDPGVTIIEDYEAANGAQAVFTSTFMDDDGDGIPSSEEGRDDLDENGEPDPRDTDDDGLPDYQDSDDDNDNVPTRNEIFLVDGGYELRFTDDDDIPDYLDPDDDNDLTPTINEDAGNTFGPLDDFVLDGNLPEVPRFRNPEAVEFFPQDSLRFTQFTRSVIVNLVIQNTNIGILQTDEIIMGTYDVEPYELPEPPEDNN